jgi:hypothetical protein
MMSYSFGKSFLNYGALPSPLRQAILIGVSGGSGVPGWGGLSGGSSTGLYSSGGTSLGGAAGGVSCGS